MLDTRASREINSYWYRRAARLPADWRWQRACKYAAHHPQLRAADHFTQAAVFEIVGDTRRRQHFDPKLARQIRDALNQYQCPDRRRLIESRLLAHHDISDAAEHCQVSVELLNIYACTFFDITERRNARRWIVDQVINDSRFVHDRLRYLLYKHAYFGGPTVAEHWLLHLPHLAKGIDHDTSTRVGSERESLEIQILAENALQTETNPALLLKVREGLLADSTLPSLTQRLADRTMSAFSQCASKSLLEELVIGEKGVKEMRAVNSATAEQSAAIA